MSRLIMWNLLTLDGFFEGANSWELDWHQDVWGEEFERLSIEQLRSADPKALSIGRRGLAVPALSALLKRYRGSMVPI
jgi:hypothetical protein